MRQISLALAGLMLMTAPLAAETVERTVKANSRAAIGGFLSYEVDTCYSAEIPDVTVRQAPANGSFQVVPHEQELGKDSRCPGKRVRGLAYVYTPKKGFKGLDEIVLDVPWRSNDLNPQSVLTYTYRIRVE
ncbi:hypothetical protein [Microvirga puerhi]|uniref:Uncharacterized protein n=1 Tax=Microvirga puerhi TaxID=2876078 RepID=A0ABS7VMC2_9HYPH|nr:hypothetical protein [Microvirga puerhi]MBZ6076230.1 hypothetical protein [Microvirga puerhi]